MSCHISTLERPHVCCSCRAEVSGVSLSQTCVTMDLFYLDYLKEQMLLTTLENTLLLCGSPSSAKQGT